MTHKCEHCEFSSSSERGVDIHRARMHIMVCCDTCNEWFVRNRADVDVNAGWMCDQHVVPKEDLVPKTRYFSWGVDKARTYRVLPSFTYICPLTSRRTAEVFLHLISCEPPLNEYLTNLRNAQDAHYYFWTFGNHDDCFIRIHSSELPITFALVCIRSKGEAYVVNFGSKLLVDGQPIPPFQMHRLRYVSTLEYKLHAFVYFHEKLIKQ